MAVSKRASGTGDTRRPGRIRLDAHLARAGVGTRSEARRLIRQGRVALDGATCRRAGERVDDRVVTVDDAVVEPPPDAVHAVLHKPVGYACSHDAREAPLVGELLPGRWIRLGLEPAGRLDRATSGLLVLTTDGALVHALTHPGRKVDKRYRVRFEGMLPPDAVARFAGGLVIRGGDRPTRPARLQVEGDGRATVVLAEGRFHQVRRMFEALGTRVVALHRDRVGDYALPEDLEPGAWRLLSEADLDALRKASTL
jgi:16S rRNA pseudouridine516 synthase